MGGRGPQSFKKRQKEQARKEKQQEKIAKRLEKNRLGPTEGGDVDADADDQTEEYGPVVVEGDDFPGSLIRPHTDSR
jgi:hypothetical protein